MPKYPFDPHQVNTLVTALIDSDRMPTLDEAKKEPLADDIVTRAAAEDWSLPKASVVRVVIKSASNPHRQSRWARGAPT